MWKADTSKKTKPVAERIPTDPNNFTMLDQAVESAEFIDAQKLQIQQTREEISQLSHIAELRKTAKQQKKRETKLKKLKERDWQMS